MRKKLIWIAPLAIVGMAVFIAIGGETGDASVELAAADVVRMAANYLLAGCRTTGSLRILFGGFGGRGLHRSNFRRRMAERWQRMTPEEREKFRQGFRGRCGPFEPRDAKPTA